MIAKALHRSEKSVRRKVETEGYTVRFEDDYSVSRLARELHVRPERIRQWIETGQLKRGRNQRVKESLLRQFLKEHSNSFELNIMEPEIRLLLLECRSSDDRVLAAAVGEG
jgi:transposase-like protein